MSENDDRTGKEPDAVVNLTFDAEGKLVGAEQEKRTQSATSSGSAQFAIRNSAKNKDSNRKDSIKEEENNSRLNKKKFVGMKPLSREEQEDFEELQREEEYQRAEQKKIQVLIQVLIHSSVFVISPRYSQYGIHSHYDPI